MFLKFCKPILGETFQAGRNTFPSNEKGWRQNVLVSAKCGGDGMLRSGKSLWPSFTKALSVFCLRNVPILLSGKMSTYLSLFLFCGNFPQLHLGILHSLNQAKLLIDWVVAFPKDKWVIPINWSSWANQSISQSHDGWVKARERWKGWKDSDHKTLTAQMQQQCSENTLVRQLYEGP